MNNTIRYCRYCNHPFIPKSNRQVYCNKIHFVKCPVCSKLVEARSNSELKRGYKSCSSSCKSIMIGKSVSSSFGSKSEEEKRNAAIKRATTMTERYGGFTLSSAVLSSKVAECNQFKYGCTNAMENKSISAKAVVNRRLNRAELIHLKFPVNMLSNSNSAKDNLEIIDEDTASVTIVKEKISISFLNKNGHRLCPKYSNRHANIGLMNNNKLYQLIRFELHNDNIVLADFGTLKGYYNPNQYTKLLDCAIKTLGIDGFKCKIPRSLATLDLTYSLSVNLISRGEYEVFWVLEDGSLKKLTQRDNIDEMKKKYDYVTTDYLDEYEYVKQEGRADCEIDDIYNLS